MNQPFLNLPPEYTSEENAYFRILPIPYEGTVCFEHGTAAGPERICAVSDQMEYIDEETLCEFWRPGIFTCAPVPEQSTPEAEMAEIDRHIRKNRLFEGNCFPIILGGEHSVSGPVLKAAAEKYPDLCVVQFDAHSDLRNEFPPGGKNSHASVMRRALEITPNLIQVGIRSFSELDLVECPEQVKRFIRPQQVEDDLAGTIAEILRRITGPVYVTFDMDAFDPAMAPGVGTPEPGGLTWRQITAILTALFREKRVIGADVVETMPLGGNNVVTEFLAARLVGKMMTAQTLYGWKK